MPSISSLPSRVSTTVVYRFVSGAHIIIWAIRKGIFGSIIGLRTKEKEHNVLDEPTTKTKKVVETIYEAV